MPAGKTLKVGVWERGSFRGVVIFSYGANNRQGQAFDLVQQQVCELTRVALTDHETPTTRIVAIALKMLKAHSPGMRLIVSYADTEQGHHGGIYAGGGWVYAGLFEVGRSGTPSFIVFGKKRHGRSLYSLGWKQNVEWLRANIDPDAEAVYPKGKHKYLFPLDKEMSTRVQSLSKPYPKRPKVAGVPMPSESGPFNSDPDAPILGEHAASHTA